MDPYFVYHIYKCLGIIPKEMSNRLGLITVIKDGY